VYFIAVGDEIAVVDGGSNELDAVTGELAGRRLEMVLQTHNHGDHTVVLRDLVAQTNVPVYAHPADPLPVSASKLDDGATIGIGGCLLKVLHTPGHTPGGVCFLLEESGESHLFSGDTLFPGGPGNTRGNADAFAQIMRSLDEKLFVLSDDTRVYPGDERPHLDEWRARGW
jgi:glyoxylase-like metal-dependent hydrolase (beta-lactamase superfamily II)